MGVRRALVGSLVMAAMGAMVAIPTPAGAAPCQAPTVSVSPSSAVAGGSFTITGKSFFIGCGDVLTRPSPDRGIVLELAAGPSPRPLGTVDAGADGGFTVTRTVPDGTPAGSGSVRAIGRQGPTETQFRVTASTTSTTAAGTTTTTTNAPTTSTSSTTLRTTTTVPATTTSAPEPEVELLDAPAETTSTSEPAGTVVTGRRGRSSSDPTGRIVLAIMLAGVAILAVSRRLYRMNEPPPPPDPQD